MSAAGRGVVVHVSSIASRLSQPGQVAYAAAKAALTTYAALWPPNSARAACGW